MQKVAVLYREPLRPAAVPERWCEHVTTSISPECHAVTLLLRNRSLPTEILAAGGLDTTIGAALVLWIDRTELLHDLAGRLEWGGADRRTYLLVESVILEYGRIDWPLGTRSPGATLLALLRKRPELSEREFRERWEHHSTLSVRLHPLTRYHRNIVVRAAGDEPPTATGWSRNASGRSMISRPNGSTSVRALGTRRREVSMDMSTSPTAGSPAR